jgi:hypothetical protein
MLWLHGLGIAVCSSRGSVDWGGEAEDYDAVECVTFCFMPVLPLRCVHVSVETAKEAPETVYHPLRFRPSSVGIAFARRWLWGLIIVALIGLVSENGLKRKGGVRAVLTATSLLAVSSLGLRFLDRGDQQNRNVRYLLGRHRFGSSDPADWTPDRLASPPSSRELYGTETFAEAIPELLRNGEYSRAMWAARLSVVLEDARAGENWTHAVLVHPGVAESLKAVRLDPQYWHAAMVGSE